MGISVVARGPLAFSMVALCAPLELFSVVSADLVKVLWSVVFPLSVVAGTLLCIGRLLVVINKLFELMFNVFYHYIF